ncbi:MAG: ABC transporter substrate-binding protein [Paludibacteraceae bacterium]|nr:ABC transporter substrate-binding protein [Paludibacteraceae bacterium]
MKHFFLSVSLPLIFSSCASMMADGGETASDLLYQYQDSILCHTDEYGDSISIKYAKGLKVDYKGDGIHVAISNPDPSAKSSKTETFVITKPSRRFVCTTALQLGNFEVLGLEDLIVGTNSLKNLFSDRIKEQIKEGKTVRIGKEGNFDMETVIAAKPDFIFVSASKHGGFESLKDCGIPLIHHHGYKETNPLGQAEWIKLVGLLTGETKRANAVFADIEKKYNTLKKEIAKKKGGKKLPTIVSGRQIRDGWYFVGGKSYMAQLFKDAGANYVMGDNQESGGVTHDFESIYAKGIHADFWQTDGSFDGEFTLKTLAAEDERYTTMDAYKNGKVLFCNLAKTPYRELAGVQPHFLLADFVKAFHPDMLPHYTPHYYKLIK